MKKQWKKRIATVVVASLLLSIQGCGSKDKASDTGKENTNTTTATAESEETKDVEYQVQAPKKGDTIVTISFKNFGDVKIKKFLANVLNDVLTPIRERRAIYENNIEAVYKMLEEGSKKARVKSEEVLTRVRKAIGVEYFK